MREKLLGLLKEEKAKTRTLRREKWKDIKNLYKFAKYYFPHFFENETPSFHHEIYALCSERRAGIAAPRGFAKSHIVQVFYGIWSLLNSREDILTISNSQDLAQEWIRKIKMELTINEKLKEDYSDLDWGDNISTKWTESHISLNKGKEIYSQMRAKGRGCQVRGFRPTKILCDDLEDDEMVKSEQRRKELRQWFLSALLRTIKKEQQLLVIGTILHPLALLSEIIDNKDYFFDWETRKYRALVKDKSIWEDRFPTKWLLGERKKDTYSFQAEYMNDPLAGTEQLFRKEWLDVAREDYNIPPLEALCISIDPAISTKEHADNTAFCVVGLGKDGDAYEIETIARKLGTWQFVEEFWKIYGKYDNYSGLVPQVIIEEVAFQQVYRKLLQQEARTRKIFLNIKATELGTAEDKRPRDKFSRALSVTHFFEQNRVHIKTKELYEELMLFPSGSRDDRVDAFVYALNRFQRWGRGIKVHNPQQTRIMSPSVFLQPKDIMAHQKLINQHKDWRLQ